MKSSRMLRACAYGLAVLCLTPTLTNGFYCFRAESLYGDGRQVPQPTGLTPEETKALDTLLLITAVPVHLLQPQERLRTPEEIAAIVSSLIWPDTGVSQTATGCQFEKNGYRFNIRSRSGSEGAPPTSQITAIPVSYGGNNRKSFYVPGVLAITFAIYCADKQGAAATATDPVLLDRRAILNGLTDKLKKVRMAVNEAKAIAELLAIHHSEVLHFLTAGKNRSYATLKQLAASAYIDPELGEGQKGGYQFSVRLNTRSRSFEAVATPAAYDDTGIRSFYVDQRGIIRGGDKKGKRAEVTDNPITSSP